jgi:hypothetical protein
MKNSIPNLFYTVVKADGTYAGVPCLTAEEAYELASQHPGSEIFISEFEYGFPEEEESE